MGVYFYNHAEIEPAFVRLHYASIDDREALLALGFQPICPEVTKGMKAVYGRHRSIRVTAPRLATA